MLDTLTPTEILAYYGLQPAYSNRSFSHDQTVILYKATHHFNTYTPAQKLGLALIIVSLGAFLAAFYPFVRMELAYQWQSAQSALQAKIQQFSASAPATDIQPSPTPSPSPDINPLVDPQGSPIVPVNTDFALIVPKVGINASIIAGVDPGSKLAYSDALKKGVAHSITSYYPDEAGTVYLFSHSTNYEWFIKDLNAVFYHLKNIEAGDLVVVMYQGNRYTYKIREKQIIKASEISYLMPQKGSRNLILQTCWPPGSTWKRLLIFADLIDTKIYGHFEEEIFRTDTNIRINYSYSFVSFACISILAFQLAYST